MDREDYGRLYNRLTKESDYKPFNINNYIDTCTQNIFHKMTDNVVYKLKPSQIKSFEKLKFNSKYNKANNPNFTKRKIVAALLGVVFSPYLLLLLIISMIQYGFEWAVAGVYVEAMEYNKYRMRQTKSATELSGISYQWYLHPFWKFILTTLFIGSIYGASAIIIQMILKKKIHIYIHLAILSFILIIMFKCIIPFITSKWGSALDWGYDLYNNHIIKVDDDMKDYYIHLNSLGLLNSPSAIVGDVWHVKPVDNYKSFLPGGKTDNLRKIDDKYNCHIEDALYLFPLFKSLLFTFILDSFRSSKYEEIASKCIFTKYANKLQPDDTYDFFHNEKKQSPPVLGLLLYTLLTFDECDTLDIYEHKTPGRLNNTDDAKGYIENATDGYVFFNICEEEYKPTLREKIKNLGLAEPENINRTPTTCYYILDHDIAASQVSLHFNKK